MLSNREVLKTKPGQYVHPDRLDLIADPVRNSERQN
jgi:hypothetical protein